ncbi:MAG: coenzyme-B sulfoethylthiotransferase subunit gamma [Halobacteriota archaeon]|nr:coenzyme-B sulfoethylthiotransferase subunit gamma [Halobacteriota archaeon]
MKISLPGDDTVAKRRRELLNPEYQPKKLRDIDDDDIVRLLGHRKCGESCKSVHPPLDELKEASDPIKELVGATSGAKAGDRIRYAQFTDSQHLAPVQPWMRLRIYASRPEFRGFDSVAFSGRTLFEQRERDLDKSAKILMESEIFDPARVALRSITVHGFSLRLDENGLMFDARRRYIYDRDTKNVLYLRNQRATELDKKISVGVPFSEDMLRDMTTAYRYDTVPHRDADELLKVVKRIGELRVLGGFRPDLINGR